MLLTSFLIFAILDIEQVLQLGLAGVAILVLSKLLNNATKQIKELNATILSEVSRRDERFIALQEKTLLAMSKNSEVMEKFADNMTELVNKDLTHDNSDKK